MFVVTISNSLVAMSQRHACQFVSRTLGTFAANAVGRADTDQQFASQDHTWAMKEDAENKPLSDDIPEETKQEVAALAEEAADSTKPASDLHLNVLTKEGLLGGKGILIDIVDENGKRVTSNHFEGEPGTEPIRLRLVQTKDGKRSFCGKMKGQTSSYSGHYELIKDGKVVQTFSVEQNGQNCLFEAIAAGTGQDPTQLRRQVGQKINEEPTKWAPAAIRQKQFDTAYENQSLFSLKGGASRLRNRKLKEYLDSFANLKPMLSNEEDKLELGKTDEYNSRAYASKNVKETEQDHIPPKKCLEGRGTSAGKELAMTVRKEHHRAVLSTGNSTESRACRDLVTELLNTDEKTATLVSYIIAHPEASNNVRRWAGLSVKNYGSKSTNYYTGGFINHAAITAYGNGNSPGGSNKLTMNDMTDTLKFVKEDMFKQNDPVVQRLVKTLRQTTDKS